jgi:hypothetical protein
MAQKKITQISTKKVTTKTQYHFSKNEHYTTVLLLKHAMKKGR